MYAQKNERTSADKVDEKNGFGFKSNKSSVKKELNFKLKSLLSANLRHSFKGALKVWDEPSM